MDRTWRRHALAIAASIGAAVVASATVAAAPRDAPPDTKNLVLQASEVPAGFVLDRRNSRYWSNAAFAQLRPDLEPLLARAGRVNGYRKTYKRAVGSRIRYILSGADTHRTVAGARSYLAWIDQQQRKSNRARARKGQQPYARAPVDVGEGGWVYIDGPPAYYVLVAWRQGRVVASLHTWGIGSRPTLALARLQEKRIHAAR
jgi:hypothetical protein